jgi:hypothetical protein
MAIMWDPPVERLTLVPTPAELAWKRWVVQALITVDDEDPSDPTDSAAQGHAMEQLAPAA